MIILGIGTGRCGTQALATFLNLQKISVQHEGSILPWAFDTDHLKILQTNLSKLSTVDYPDVGDINFSLLNYIEPLIQQLHQESSPHNALRVICLKRDKAETVKSWMTNQKNYNFWSVKEHSSFTLGLYLRNDTLENSFPKYDLDKENALMQFWDDYYAETSRLEKLYPDFIKTFDMKTLLSEPAVQEDMLDFIEIVKSKRFVTAFKNKIDDKARDTDLELILSQIPLIPTLDIEFRSKFSVNVLVLYNFLKIALNKNDQEMPSLLASSEYPLDKFSELKIILCNDENYQEEFFTENRSFISYLNTDASMYNYFPKAIENLRKLISLNLLK